MFNQALSLIGCVMYRVVDGVAKVVRSWERTALTPADAQTTAAPL